MQTTEQDKFLSHVPNSLSQCSRERCSVEEPWYSGLPGRQFPHRFRKESLLLQRKQSVEMHAREPELLLQAVRFGWDLCGSARCASGGACVAGKTPTVLQFDQELCSGSSLLVSRLSMAHSRIQ